LTTHDRETITLERSEIMNENRTPSIATDDDPTSGLAAVPLEQLELVHGGMRCDSTGNGPTYDNEAGVCRADDIILVCSP
jgi:hypothetical protein